MVNFIKTNVTHTSTHKDAHPERTVRFWYAVRATLHPLIRVFCIWDRREGQSVEISPIEMTCSRYSATRVLNSCTVWKIRDKSHSCGPLQSTSALNEDAHDRKCRRWKREVTCFSWLMLSLHWDEVAEVDAKCLLINMWETNTVCHGIHLVSCYWQEWTDKDQLFTVNYTNCRQNYPYFRVQCKRYMANHR